MEAPPPQEPQPELEELAFAGSPDLPDGSLPLLSSSRRGSTVQQNGRAGVLVYRVPPTARPPWHQPGFLAYRDVLRAIISAHLRCRRMHGNACFVRFMTWICRRPSRWARSQPREHS
jgi:hypothetical protein